MPFRITSSDPYERQIAILNLALLGAMATGTDLYVGMCGCETSAKNGVLIIASERREHCVFCGRRVELTCIYQSDKITWAL